MKRVRSVTASVPLHSPLPEAGAIETVAFPAMVTMLIAADAQCTVVEGAKVAAGFPLCNRPDPGTFASVNGTVRRILPWDAGVRGNYTAVMLERSASDGEQHRLFDPAGDPFSIEPDALRERARSAGFRFSDEPMPLLVNGLDEDIDRVVSRWVVQHEFDRFLAGLRMLRHLSAASVPVIALDASLAAEKRRQCAPFGTVITLPARYPDTAARQIVRRYPGLFPGGRAAVIGSQRVLDFAEALSTGRAPASMLVSLRIGRRGRVRLFNVPIGISVGDLLDHVNCPIADGMMVVMGGIMTGGAANSGAQPVVYGCDSIQILTRDETVVPENTPCVNCGRCADVCPEGLRVDLIGKNVEFAREKDAVRLGIHQCVGCGLCTVACIVHRPLGHLLAFGKANYAREARREGTA